MARGGGVGDRRESRKGVYWERWRRRAGMVLGFIRSQDEWAFYTGPSRSQPVISRWAYLPDVGPGPYSSSF
jgi:hypothetical protein